MLERLVAFDTVSRNSNLALIDFVRNWLDDFGIRSRLVHSACGHKANLFATIGPEESGGLVLSGHTDVVPVDDQDWSSDPFRVIERDERLYGRGTCDMKGFIAVVLALVPEIVGRRLDRPIHLAFTHDEEVGCRGVKELLEELSGLPFQPGSCIVGEPTNMSPVVAHKGKRNFRCRVRGRECHSSLTHQGVNAIEVAAELISRLRRLADFRRDEGPFDAGFDPPYSTIQTGVIDGGTALNIVPRHCSFEFELRTLPDDDPQSLVAELFALAERELLPVMRAVDPEAAIEFEELAAYRGLRAAEDEAVVALAKDLSGIEQTGKVSYGTEAGMFQGAGIPAVVCGPGSIRQAHRPDEYVELSELSRCEAFIRDLFGRIAESPKPGGIGPVPSAGSAS